MIRIDDFGFNTLMYEYIQAEDKNNFNEIACKWLTNNQVYIDFY